VGRLHEPVSLRALLIALALTALVAAGGGVAASVFLLQRGARGPAGPTGEQGPEGPVAGLEEDEVRSIAEEEATSAAQSAVEDQNPSPDDVAGQVDDVSGEVDQVKSDLASLCSDLSLSDALSDTVLSC
jgi:hypothetical protein